VRLLLLVWPPLLHATANDDYMAALKAILEEKLERKNNRPRLPRQTYILEEVIFCRRCYF
jgi:hypothetical protein